MDRIVRKGVGVFVGFCQVRRETGADLIDMHARLSSEPKLILPALDSTVDIDRTPCPIGCEKGRDLPGIGGEPPHPHIVGSYQQITVGTLQDAVQTHPHPTFLLRQDRIGMDDTLLRVKKMDTAIGAQDPDAAGLGYQDSAGIERIRYIELSVGTAVEVYDEDTFSREDP